MSLLYMELGSYFVSARTNKRHHYHRDMIMITGNVVSGDMITRDMTTTNVAEREGRM
jgi:hypothetical protein